MVGAWMKSFLGIESDTWSQDIGIVSYEQYF